MCNYLNAGNLAKLYILGEHIKYNNINSNQFNLFSLNIIPDNMIAAQQIILLGT